MLYVVFFYLAIGVALTTMFTPTRKDGARMVAGEAVFVRVVFVLVWAPVIAAIIIMFDEE